ncbi:MAG: hypothetical protein H6595_02340 [Flavobacteriales bacterium]|nr:hypothetical protein [Flavobacteriales bacterium]
MNILRTSAMVLLLTGPLTITLNAQGTADPMVVGKQTAAQLQKELGLDDDMTKMFAELLGSAEKEVADDRTAMAKHQGNIDRVMDETFTQLSTKLTPEQREKLNAWRMNGGKAACCAGAAKGASCGDKAHEAEIRKERADQAEQNKTRTTLQKSDGKR